MSGAGSQPPGANPAERPAEVVELCELLYRQIFTAGLFVAVFMTVYAAFLSLLRPERTWLTGFAVSMVLVVPVTAALVYRAPCYRFLRRYPIGILIPATLVGGGAWMIGESNEQMLYVVTLTLGVCGLTVPFRYVLGGACVAGLGIGMPALLAAQPRIDSTAFVSISIPVIFWLVIEQIASYMLSTDRPAPQGAARARSAAPPAEPQSSADRWRRFPARLAGQGQRLLSRGARPNHERAVKLSARQTEVLLLRAEGLNHDEIGACLDIGAQQVRRQLRDARSKTKSRTTPALMAWAIRQGVLAPGRPTALPNTAFSRGYMQTEK